MEEKDPILKAEQLLNQLGYGDDAISMRLESG
jgi:hypothetical protein